MEDHHLHQSKSSPLFKGEYGDLSSGLSHELDELRYLASNMYWTWNREIRRIFERIDPASWDGLGHNPIALLKRTGAPRLEEIARDGWFKSGIHAAAERQSQYLEDKDTKFQESQELIAYFSAEFGFAECFKIYSGGLGVLSGDHLKSASDLGMPLVGVGLFYKKGYFSQSIDPTGWQVESYPENDPGELPCEPVLSKGSGEPLVVTVPIGTRSVSTRVWKVSIGRVPLFLLDTDLPSLNSKEDCEITASLYGGDSETRVKQEMILGFGGAKALKALEIYPSVFHMNEGHAAFVTLERVRQVMNERGLTFKEARSQVKPSNIFTTHTPVPAGIDVFEPDKVASHLSWYCDEVKLSQDELLELGRDGGFGFNMAVLAIKFSGIVNAVSRLHREVAVKLWADLFAKKESQSSPGREEIKAINCVTNGVHIPTWVSDGMSQLYEEYLGPNWIDNTDSLEMWARVDGIPDSSLWEARCRAREALIEFVRSKFSFSGYGVTRETILDPSTLTIGFSRRFATYKRANLFLKDRERFQRILDGKDKVQFVFSGKAHPRDHEAKLYIQEIVNYCKSKESQGRVIFLQDYDLQTAKKLVSGVDVWLNNPRRPHEACGTSGMKAIPNGAINLSVLDGWWAEAYSPDCGWAIGDGSVVEDYREQDRRDAESLYETLEKQVIPEFYDRENALPKKWLKRMKKSISTLSPRFNTRRMLQEYAKFYFRNEPEMS